MYRCFEHQVALCNNILPEMSIHIKDTDISYYLRRLPVAALIYGI